MDKRFDEVAKAINKVEEEMRKLDMQIEEDLPWELVSQLHVLACSVNYFTFWVRQQVPPEGKPEMWYAEEVETGVGNWGVSAREALDNYFRDDVLDNVRSNGR